LAANNGCVDAALQRWRYSAATTAAAAWWWWALVVAQNNRARRHYVGTPLQVNVCHRRDVTRRGGRCMIA